MLIDLKIIPNKYLKQTYLFLLLITLPLPLEKMEVKVVYYMGI